MRIGNKPDIFCALRTLDHNAFMSLVPGRINETCDFGRSLLHEAIVHEKLKTALALIDAGASVDGRDHLGRTPLHYAATYNQPVLVDRLLAADSNVNATDNYGNIPLWAAILSPVKEYEVITLLVEGGSSLTLKNKAGRSIMTMAETIGDRGTLTILRDSL